MADAEEHHDLSQLFEAARLGDKAARNQILTLLNDRIIRLTAVILRDFPIVAQKREVESVANELHLKLISALDAGVEFETTEDFIRFVAQRLCGLLINEAEKYRRRGPMMPIEGDDASSPQHDAGTSTLNPARLAQWTEFQRQIDLLPQQEQDVFRMHYFLGQSKPDIAKVLSVDQRTIRNRWQDACNKLAEHIPT